MSYAKMMKHARNVRKLKKQRKMYMGFDTGSGSWPSAWNNPYLAAIMNIRAWFKLRNQGDSDERQRTRECIREQIHDARAALDSSQSKSTIPNAPYNFEINGPSKGFENV